MRPNRFTFLCSEADRANLARIATFLERSESDALRWLIRRAIRELDHHELSQEISSDASSKLRTKEQQLPGNETELRNDDKTQ